MLFLITTRTSIWISTIIFLPLYLDIVSACLLHVAWASIFNHSCSIGCSSLTKPRVPEIPSSIEIQLLLLLSCLVLSWWSPVGHIWITSMDRASPGLLSHLDVRFLPDNMALFLLAVPRPMPRTVHHLSFRSTLRGNVSFWRVLLTRATCHYCWDEISAHGSI